MKKRFLIKFIDIDSLTPKRHICKENLAVERKSGTLHKKGGQNRGFDRLARQFVYVEKVNGAEASLLEKAEGVTPF